MDPHRKMGSKHLDKIETCKFVTRMWRLQLQFCVFSSRQKLQLLCVIFIFLHICKRFTKVIWPWHLTKSFSVYKENILIKIKAKKILSVNRDYFRSAIICIIFFCHRSSQEFFWPHAQCLPQALYIRFYTCLFHHTKYSYNVVYHSHFDCDTGLLSFQQATRHAGF